MKKAWDQLVCSVTSAFLWLFCWENLALAHERWIEHEPLEPIHNEIFQNFSSYSFAIICRPLALIFALGILWILRHHLAYRAKSFTPRFLHSTLDFIFMTETRALWGEEIQRIILQLMIRIPSLGLIYAAANSCLLLPSFPLIGGLNTFFRVVQTILALMILAELALPIVGITIALLLLVCFGFYGFSLGVDGLPMLGLSYIYWQYPSLTHQSSYQYSAQQMRGLQIILGIAFLLLGLLKFANYQLMIGVIDHYPEVMHDPLIQIFSTGSDPQFAREWWVFGFACSEVMTGVLLILGVFARVLALLAALIFGKLLVGEFGWAEFPHLMFISQLILIASCDATSTASPFVPKIAELEDLENLSWNLSSP